MIGDRIKQRREELGYSQEKLAKLMGYKSTSTIAKIESNINDVTQSNIVKFAKVLNCTTSYLMEWDEPQNDKDYMIKSKDDFEVPIEIKKEIKKLNKKQIVLLIAFLKMLNEQN